MLHIYHSADVENEIRIHDTFTSSFAQGTALFPLGVAYTTRLEKKNNIKKKDTATSLGLVVMSFGL